MRLGHFDVERDWGVPGSLLEFSHSEGYLSLNDLVGLDSTTRVSALPFESTVKTTDVLTTGLGVSEIDDREARLPRSRLRGDDRRAKLTAELLRVSTPECAVLFWPGGEFECRLLIVLLRCNSDLPDETLTNDLEPFWACVCLGRAARTLWSSCLGSVML